MKPRYIFRLVLAFIKRFKILILAGVLFGILGFLLIKYISPRIFGKTSEIIGLTGKYKVEELPTSILNLAGEGLTKIDQLGEPVPALAQSWSSQDGGKTWEFSLKNNIFWQDKTRITSKDINYQFEGVTIEKPNSNTIIFKLQTKFSAFPTIVSHPVFKNGLLGSGNWKVTTLRLSGANVQDLTLVDNKFNKKIFKFFPTQERTKLAFELGEVNEIKDLIDPKPFTYWQTANVTPVVNKSRFMAVFFNTEDKILSDKTVRQALSYAINKDAFIGIRNLGPISSLSWAYNPQIKNYNYDLLKAQNLIKTITDQTKSKINLKLITSPLLLQEAEMISKDWNNAGIKSQVLVSSILPEEYQAFLAIYDTPPDPDQYATWHSTQIDTNISKYKNPRIDKLLEDGRIETDFEIRKKIYLDFQRFLLEDAPAAFIVNPTTYDISRK